MKRPKLAMVAAAAAATLALSACAGPAATAPSTPSPVGGSIDFSWWGGDARNKYTQAVIDLYQKAHPNVTIKGSTTDFGSYWQKASVQASGKNLPCVPQMQNRTMSDYADRGSLMPLDDLVKNGTIDVSNIPPSVLDSGRGADGKLYEIPYGVAFGGVAVNTTQLQQLGIGLPPSGSQYDWNWFSNWLKSIHSKTGSTVTGLIGGNQDLFEAWVRSHGEDLFSKDGGLGFSKQTLADFWSYSEDLRKAGVTDDAARASEIVNQAVEQSDMSQGKQQVREIPPNQLSAVQQALNTTKPGQKVAAYTLPNGPQGSGAALWASGLSISSNCKNVSTAASFINFFVNDEQAALAFHSDNGADTNVKTLDALTKSPDISQAVKDQLSLYKSLVDGGVKPVTYKKGYAAIFANGGGMITRYYQQVAFGKLSLNDAVNQFFADANGQLG